MAGLGLIGLIGLIGLESLLMGMFRRVSYESSVDICAHMLGATLGRCRLLLNLV